MQRQSLSFLKATVLVGGIALAAFPRTAERVSPDRYVAHVKTLASPEMQGRGAGTEGIKRASQYIADQFREFGLRPAGADGTYWQPFSVTTGAKPGERNHVSISGASPLKLGTDFTPLSFSSNARVTGGLVFAGYGITAPEFEHDDYKGLDVKDRIVVVLRYEPSHFRKGTGKEKAHTHHASLVSKAINARNRGAKAVVLVDVPEAGRAADLIKFGAVAGPDDVGIVMAQVKHDIVARWAMQANQSLNGATPFRFPDSTKMTLEVDIRREQAEVRNVAGFVPGRGKEYIIIGAHYDHLGLGSEHSLAPSKIGSVHPGADDNASGTAGLLELARMFGRRAGELERGVLFLAFAGEEIGLLGSAHWANKPTLPIENATAMINMDMIGRVNGSKLYIGGVGTGSSFAELVREMSKAYSFKIDSSADGYSASDHTSFLGKSIPSLFFFSGLHGDYHKPSDTWDKISGATSAQVVDLVFDIAERLAAPGERPKFARVQPANPHAGGVPGAPSGGGYGPYFGSVPDFAPVEKGVKFSDVRPGSPAAKAGLQPGDIMIGFGDKPVNNLYDFTFALRNSKAGDVVVVKYIRNGKDESAKVTLEERR